MSRLLRVTFSLGPLALLPALVFSSHAATIHVPGDQPTIQAGIDAASAGDTVLVACGTYNEQDIVMKSGVCLRSATGMPDCATIDAQQLGRVLYCDNVDSTACIEGFTITGGYADHGGGMWCGSSSPRVSNCNVSGNSVPLGGQGGGMWCSSSSPTITDCVFSGNESGDRGGGIYCGGGSAPSLSRCVFSSNSGAIGGGICSYQSSPTITDCVLHTNTANNGGGLYCFYCSPPLTGCVLYSNSADLGGGLFCLTLSSPTLTNCTLSSNSAAQGGGGIYAAGASSPTVENTIVAASLEGEAVGCDATSSPTLTCSNLFGNAGGDWVGCIADQFGTNGNISRDPLFCNPPQGNYGLGSNSPCLPDSSTCGLIGALGDSCTAEEQQTIKPTTWSLIKALYWRSDE